MEKYEEEIDNAVEEFRIEIQRHKLSNTGVPREVSIKFWGALRDSLQSDIEAAEEGDV